MRKISTNTGAKRMRAHTHRLCQPAKTNALVAPAHSAGMPVFLSDAERHTGLTIYGPVP